MVWFRVDDVLTFHPRVLEAGNAAIGLWVRAGAWSMNQLTDGFVPAAIARQLGSTAEIKRLITSGLWQVADGGYQFHAWAEAGDGSVRQPTREQVHAKRESDRKRKQDTARRGVEARQKPRGVDQDSARKPDGTPLESKRLPKPPDPTRPDPESAEADSLVSPGKPATRRRTTIPADFSPNENHRSYAAEHQIDLESELERFRNHALMTGRLGIDWNAGFRNWLSKAIEFAAQQRRPTVVGGRESSLDRRDRQREQMFADLDGLDQVPPQWKAIGA